MRNFKLAELRKSEYTEKTKMEDNKSTRITFGSALAMVISYTMWKSVGRAIFMDYLVGGMSYIFFCVTKFLI